MLKNVICLQVQNIHTYPLCKTTRHTSFNHMKHILHTIICGIHFLCTSWVEQNNQWHDFIKQCDQIGIFVKGFGVKFLKCSQNIWQLFDYVWKCHIKCKNWLRLGNFLRKKLGYFLFQHLVRYYLLLGTLLWHDRSHDFLQFTPNL